MTRAFVVRLLVSTALTLAALAMVLGHGNDLGIAQSGGTQARLDATGGGNSVALARSGLAPGRVMQRGARNGVTLTLGSGLVEASAVIFAGLQQRSDNTITGTIEGDGNQALLIQVGSAHAATFAQLGGSNYLSATQ